MLRDVNVGTGKQPCFQTTPKLSLTIITVMEVDFSDVSVNDFQSKSISVDCRVTQGSIQGLLEFIFYTEDVEILSPITCSLTTNSSTDLVRSLKLTPSVINGAAA